MKRILSVILILAVIGGAILFVVKLRPEVPKLQTNQTPQSFTFTQNYRDEVVPVSFQYPAKFKVRTLDVQDEVGDAIHTILVESGVLEEGIQIVVTPYNAEKPITAALIREKIPDLKVIDEQALELGDTSEGVAFKSDNSAFGGDSREVWFEYNGMLYQISAYASNDAFLKSFFSTWQLH